MLKRASYVGDESDNEDVGISARTRRRTNPLRPKKVLINQVIHALAPPHTQARGLLFRASFTMSLAMGSRGTALAEHAVNDDQYYFIRMKARFERAHLESCRYGGTGTLV